VDKHRPTTKDFRDICRNTIVVTSNTSHVASWRSLKSLAKAVDESNFLESIAEICDPASGSLSEAIRRANFWMEDRKRFDLSLAKFLQVQSYAHDLQLPTILRGLEVLETITEEANLFTVLRFFLRSDLPQVVSKCVLIVGRRCQNVDWIRGIIGSEIDGRIRANLIEALWARSGEPEIKVVLKDALNDRHHRVAGNALYGLFLSGYEDYRAGIDKLTSNSDPAFRSAGIWVIRSIGTNEAVVRIKPLIRDPDKVVRSAAFAALAFLRKRATEKTAGAEPCIGCEVAAPAEQLCSAAAE
jgi:hypothetical protein